MLGRLLISSTDPFENRGVLTRQIDPRCKAIRNMLQVVSRVIPKTAFPMTSEFPHIKALYHRTLCIFCGLYWRIHCLDNLVALARCQEEIAFKPILARVEIVIAAF